VKTRSKTDVHRVGGRRVSGNLTCAELTKSDYPAWVHFVRGSSSGSVYSLPGYLQILCEVTGGNFRVIGVYKGSELLGGIALYEQPDRAGTIASSRLLLYYHGIVLRDYDTKYPSECTSRRLAVVTELEGWLSRQSYTRLSIHNRHPVKDLRPFLVGGWTVRPNYSYVVQISNLDKTWNRIEQNLRRLIRRAESNGLIVTEDDDFDEFYRLHRGTHERKGAPLYLPEDRFRHYFRRLREASLGRLFHIRTAEGTVVASQLVLLGGHPVTHTVCAAADHDYLKQGTTPFLRWKVFEALSNNGFEANDLTDAALNEVTRFKSQLGGDLMMNSVITRPDAWRFRLDRALARFIRRGRAFAGTSLRRLGLRSEGGNR
jgi:hypothetical protein